MVIQVCPSSTLNPTLAGLQKALKEADRKMLFKVSGCTGKIDIEIFRADANKLQKEMSKTVRNRNFKRRRSSQSIGDEAHVCFANLVVTSPGTYYIVY